MRRRLACPRCAPTRFEHHRRARVTPRLFLSMALLCAVSLVRHAAHWHGLDLKAAQTINMNEMECTVPSRDLEDERLLAMDEFAIQKGPPLATVEDVERKRVLWAGRGGSRAALPLINFPNLHRPPQKQSCQSFRMNKAQWKGGADPSRSCHPVPCVRNAGHGN